MYENLKALILAAGKGTRMQKDGDTMAKVMRLAHGKPLLHYVVSALDFIEKSDTILVVGYQKEVVQEAFEGYAFAEQKEQLGTGHAVTCGMVGIEDFEGDILVCCGDMPLILKDTYTALCKTHTEDGNDCTILTEAMGKNLPYGRIVRDENGDFSAIVEEKDANEAQKAITELNSGVYIFKANALRNSLNELSCSNAQKEYYLTDTPKIIMQKGGKIGICKRDLGIQILGVNTPEQLTEVEQALTERK